MSLTVESRPTFVADVARPDRPKRPVYVILGMHRSGTSLCSSIMNTLGVDMIDEAGRERGPGINHWERLDLLALQDEVLALFDRAYYSPYHDYPLPPAWWAEPRLKAIEAKIQALVAGKLAESRYFGFKDPRTVKLVPLWRRIFAALGLEPRYIVCLRNPHHVARSLEARDGLELGIGEFRALDYMVDCLRYSTGSPRCLIEYEEWFATPYETARRLQSFLGLDSGPDPDDLKIALDGLIQVKLNRQGAVNRQARQPLVRHFYNLSLKLKDDPAHPEEVNAFTNSFVTFKQLLSPFETLLRRSRAELAAMSDSSAQTAGLQSANDKLQAELAAAQAANAALDQRATRLAGRVEDQVLAWNEAREAWKTAEQHNQRLRAENDVLRASLEALRAEADAAKATVLVQNPGQIEELQSNYARLQDELRAALAAHAAAEARVEALRAVNEAHAAEHERADAAWKQANQYTADLRAAYDGASTELDAARSALGAYEQRAAELLAVNQTQSMALAECQSALADANHYAKTLQAAYDEVRTELDASRAVEPQSRQPAAIQG